MVYECDECSAPLPAGVTACPKCGRTFDDEVPADAEVPKRGFTAVPSDKVVASGLPLSTAEIVAEARRRADVLNSTPSYTSSSFNSQPPYVAQKNNPWNQNVGFGGLLILLFVAGTVIYGFNAVFGTKDHQDSSSATSPVSALVSATHSVTYKVSGSARSASITYQNGQGGTEGVGAVNLPWSKDISTESGAFLYISAQNQGETGSITTEILVDGQPFKQSVSEGAYQIAQADGRL